MSWFDTIKATPVNTKPRKVCVNPVCNTKLTPSASSKGIELCGRCTRKAREKKGVKRTGAFPKFLNSKIEKKGSRSMSIHAKKLIEEVMLEVTEPKTPREILELMYDKMSESKNNFNTGASTIPTGNELKYYLGKNYNSGYFDKITGKPRKQSRSGNSITKYWGDAYELV
jgi:hypothetical protein